MEKFNFEAIPKKNLISILEKSGLNKEEIKNFESLISKIKFINIDINSKEEGIHIDMIASLLARQENGDIFLQNILKSINHNWQEAEEFLISSTKEIESESIDLDVGTNRRVDKIECVFDNELAYDFTLSADLIDYEDKNDSNSYTEKQIFESPLAKDNPILQNYFGYSEKNLSGRNYRLIAKEYLPGKNIAQYFNEMHVDSSLNTVFDDLSCELAYSMGYLYKRMDGQLLEDLKLENIIYNYKNPDSDKSACRICDHSGYYDNNPEMRSVTQIMGQLTSLLTMYFVKLGKLERDGIVLESGSPEDILVNYLDSFFSEVDDDKLKKLFIEKLKELKKIDPEKRMFEIPDDLLDFVEDYLVNQR
ncbi:MAG: hypothetical protein ACOYL8_03460 [Patescibacteria group bacterium]